MLPHVSDSDTGQPPNVASFPTPNPLSILVLEEQNEEEKDEFLLSNRNDEERPLESPIKTLFQSAIEKEICGMMRVCVN